MCRKRKSQMGGTVRKASNGEGLEFRKERLRLSCIRLRDISEILLHYNNLPDFISIFFIQPFHKRQYTHLLLQRLKVLFLS